MLKQKNEAKAITAWLKQWKWNPNVRLYKIPDDSVWRKPFDIVGCIDWKPTAIEAKYCSTKKIPTVSWAFRKLEPHQVINLNNFRLTKWKSYILVYHNETKQYFLFDFDECCKELWDEIEKIYFMYNKIWAKDNLKQK